RLDLALGPLAFGLGVAGASFALGGPQGVGVAARFIQHCPHLVLRFGEILLQAGSQFLGLGLGLGGFVARPENHGLALPQPLGNVRPGEFAQNEQQQAEHDERVNAEVVALEAGEIEAALLLLAVAVGFGHALGGAFGTEKRSRRRGERRSGEPDQHGNGDRQAHGGDPVRKKDGQPAPNYMNNRTRQSTSAMIPAPSTRPASTYMAPWMAPACSGWR